MGARTSVQAPDSQPKPLNAATALLMALDAEADEDDGGDAGAVEADALRRR
jgi:hypothetical protein